MEQLENLQTYLLWLIIGFITFAYFLPSLSSFIKEKLTGKIEEEKFDLDQMIFRKQEIFDRQAQAYRYAFEKKAHQSDEYKNLQSFIKEIYWGAGPFAQELYDYARQKHEADELSWNELRASYLELIKNEKFNQNDHLLDFDFFKEVVTEYTLKSRELQSLDQKEQVLERLLELGNKTSP